MKNIILIAAPGAGKGTLAKSLKEKYDYVHISTGDLLRDAVSKGDELGLKIKDILAQGLLVEDEIVYQVLKNRLQEADCKNGIIMDGFPRNVNQAVKYEEILSDINIDLGVAILLDIEESKLIERITGRRLCSQCGEIYNIYNPAIAPKVENICNKCGSALYQRSDDNEEALKSRYATYVEKTQPLIDYYKNKNNLYIVDSGKELHYTLEQVEKILNDLGDELD